MKIERFEDLIAWQEARKLVNLIYDLTQKNSFKDFGLANQIQRSSVSVMANISEGFGRYSFKDSKQFFTIARESVLGTKATCILSLIEKRFLRNHSKIYMSRVVKLVN